MTKHATEIPAQDGDAFGVDRAAELSFALDVDDSLATERDDRGDAHRLAELDVIGRKCGQSVDHAHARAAGVERNFATHGEFANVSLCGSESLSTFAPRKVDIVSSHDRRSWRTDRSTEWSRRAPALPLAK